MSEFKSAFIAVVGRPNVGKSTIINKITGEKVSIITKKPQTTRTRILAILNKPGYQIVFVDTPGVHRARNRLGNYMNDTALRTIGEVDAAIFVVDAVKGFGIPEEKIVNELKTKEIPTILAINKIDAVNKESLLPMIAKASEQMDYKAVVPLSALYSDGVDILLSEAEKFLLPGPMFYPEDAITDKTEREMAAEMIREKLLRLLDEEVPHGTAVEIYEMKDMGRFINIGANIYCESASHKPIILGKGGAMLKKIGTYAREDMESFFGRKVNLTTWVKVKDDWRNDSFMLKSLGFTSEE
jgi:GTP-binding protein Era